MDVDTAKLLAKIAGENVENFANCVVSDSAKTQIDFAFNQMFQGLSLLQWMENITLMNAWQNTLDAMTEFVFSLPEKNCVAEYLHVAVFDFKKNTLKTLKNSIHANEYFNYPKDKQDELKQSANEKIQQGIDIIKSLVSAPDKCMTEKTQPMEKVQAPQKIKIREYERERERK